MNIHGALVPFRRMPEVMLTISIVPDVPCVVSLMHTRFNIEETHHRPPPNSIVRQTGASRKTTTPARNELRCRIGRHRG